MDLNVPVPFGPTFEGDTLLLRETIHRCNNDLQLVISLLALQSRRATTSEARDALNDAVERVSILTRARLSLLQRGQSIEVALQQVCEALQSQAGPRGIGVSLDISHSPHGLSPSKIIAVSLAVNELATNAIKHAFEEKKSGYVRVSLRRPTPSQVIILVDDDGLPFPELAPRNGRAGGLGIDLVKRLVASTGGLLIVPAAGSKIFELRIPAEAN